MGYFAMLIDQLQDTLPHLNRTLAWLADVDVTCALALKTEKHVSSGRNLPFCHATCELTGLGQHFVRPKIVPDAVLELVGSRHPIVESQGCKKRLDRVIGFVLPTGLDWASTALAPTHPNFPTSVYPLLLQLDK